VYEVYVCVCVCVRTRAHPTTCISPRIRRRVPAPGRVRTVSPQTCQVLFAAVAAPRWSYRLHLTSALVPLHTHTQRAASAPRLTVQCTHSMLRFPPAQLDAPATVFPSRVRARFPPKNGSDTPPKYVFSPFSLMYLQCILSAIHPLYLRHSDLGGVTAPSGRRPCVLEGAEKAPFGMRRDGVLNTLNANRPFDAESST